MDTKIWAALIAVGGVITQVAVTYLVNRQSANDLRTNISREIDIVRNLRPGSAEATNLEAHISKSVSDLIARDERRDRLSDILWTFGPLPVLALAIWGLTVWREHGVPNDLRVLVGGVYGGLIAVGLVVAVQLAWQFARLFWLILLRWSLEIRLWWAKRKSAEVDRRIEEIKPKFFALREYDRQVVDYMMAHKDEIIAGAGQEWWDDMMARRAELDREGAELEAKFRADDEAADDDV